MADITELAQRMKAAAVRAKTATEEYASGHMSVSVCYAECEEFNRLTDGPDNILALVEALEKAQQRISELEAYSKTALKFREAARDENRHLKLSLKAVEDRVIELESRTVTVKQGEVLVTVAGFTGCGKSAVAGEIEIAMKAIGVPVTWANGDSEKRMTGADWLTAIEMYKPTVRIVEVNIPRGAGIKVEAE
ncbi:ead/Ea22-like family protein [Klebsiella variicola]|uniref:ead/Ea22-like family protein n=1 Tax=Klebsiella variicola TaxID=244366 RepID=UPI000E2ADBAF|nr:ead/Ea22-like family protein [Klebsiella variicola]SXE31851.1 Uncharacterised protein [Klebsiella variicola]